MSKVNKNEAPNQVPTVTSKSSGLDYVRAQLNPSQKIEKSREKATKNDKG